MTYSILLSIHVIICLLVVLVVMIQSGKGAGFAGLMGGGGGDALFSAPSGSSFIRKITAAFAAAFFLTSLGLTYLGARGGPRTVIRYTPPPPQAPAAPAGTPMPAPTVENTAPPVPPTPAAPGKKK